MTIRLCIDIGNSTCDSAIYKEDVLFERWQFATKDFEDFSLEHKVDNIIVSSVVKSKDETFKKILKEKTGIVPHFVSINDFPQINWEKYFNNPEEIGADILVGAFTASQMYVNQNVLIFDFGTATTLVGVNSKREFLGGLILPGLELQAKALFDNTDQLEKCTIYKTPILFGSTTESAINSGIFHAHVGAIKEYISLAGSDYVTIATGGAMHLFSEAIHFDAMMDDLVLKGLLGCIGR